MSRERPYKEILDPEVGHAEAEVSLAPQIDLLEQLAAYGSNLIPRCFHGERRGLRDLIILHVFLRQFVTAVDSVSILTRQGATFGARPAARMAVESSLYIDFLTGKEEPKAYRVFYVSSLRKKRLWARRVVPGTPEHDKFLSVGAELGADRPNFSADKERLGRAEIADIERVLSRYEFSDINDRFEKLRGRKSYEPHWLTYFGLSLRGLAYKLERTIEYEIFYAPAAEFAHSSSYTDFATFSAESIEYFPIRSLRYATPLIREVVPVAMTTYRKILDHYRPDEVSSLNRKWMAEWRDPFFKSPEIREGHDDDRGRDVR